MLKAYITRGFARARYYFMYEIKGWNFTHSLKVRTSLVALNSNLRAKAGDGYLSPHAPGCSDPSLRARSIASEAMWLLLRDPEKLKAEDRQLLDHIFRASNEIVTTCAFAQKFQSIVRERDHPELTSWLWQARRCQVRELKGFAAGLQRDLGAVKAALTHEWSNGQIEGQVNKLKTIKRQMYGRANFDLLRARALQTV